MSDLTPNPRPRGESCGTCRFAGTHTHAVGAAKTLVRCLRYPPQRLGQRPEYNPSGDLFRGKDDTSWPILTWDDWCGEWKARDEIVAEAERLRLQQAVNHFLRGSTEDVNFDHAHAEMASVVAELAPGWTFRDKTRKRSVAPEVELLRYCPGEPL